MDEVIMLITLSLIPFQAMIKENEFMKHWNSSHSGIDKLNKIA